jgi:hypothetical protein
MTRVYQAEQILYLTLDGPASFSKLDEQRKRRVDNAWSAKRTGNFDSQQFTPGCTFMTRFEEFIKEMVLDGITRAPKVIISGASCPGEGEFKMFEEIRQSALKNPNISRAVVALDSDTYVQSIIHGIPRMHVMIPTWEPESRFGNFDVDQCTQILREQAQGRCNAQWRLDFALLTAFSGNDYLPAMPFGNYSSLWPAYCKQSTAEMINVERRQIDVHKFKAFLQHFMKYHFPPVHQNFQNTLLKLSRERPKKTHENIVSFLRSAVGVVNLTSGHIDPAMNIDYRNDCSPSIGVLADLDPDRVAEDLVRPSTNASQVEPLMPGAAAVMVLDMSERAVKYLPPAMHPIARAYTKRKRTFKSDHDGASWVHEQINALTKSELGIQIASIFPRQPLVLTNQTRAVGSPLTDQKETVSMGNIKTCLI